MLAIKPKFNLKKPYILVYMLGEISAEYQTTIKKLAKQNNAEIINALKGKCKFINPLEFIWLINNATYVCTDSFHASVFRLYFIRSCIFLTEEISMQTKIHALLHY